MSNLLQSVVCLLALSRHQQAGTLHNVACFLTPFVRHLPVIKHGWSHVERIASDMPSRYVPVNRDFFHKK